MTERTSIWFVLTPPVLLLDYAGPAEVLRMAVGSGAPFDLHHCGPEPVVPTSIGTSLQGIAPLPDELPPGSLVIVVGTTDVPAPGKHAPLDRAVQWLGSRPAGTTRLASICSGALLLARAGHLAGRRCTTHHALIDALRAEDSTALVSDDSLFIDDGDVLTSAGITAGIDLALYLIEQLAGPQLAAEVARRQVIYQRRAGSDTQISPWLAHRNHLHPAVHRVQDAITADPVRVWSAADLARVAHVSPRHLSRLFAQHAGVSVTLYQQQLRVARAQQLLQTTHLTVDRVAEEAGFHSTRDFRRVWRLYNERSPRWDG